MTPIASILSQVVRGIGAAAHAARVARTATSSRGLRGAARTKAVRRRARRIAGIRSARMAPPRSAPAATTPRKRSALPRAFRYASVMFRSFQRSTARSPAIQQFSKLASSAVPQLVSMARTETEQNRLRAEQLRRESDLQDGNNKSMAKAKEELEKFTRALRLGVVGVPSAVIALFKAGHAYASGVSDSFRGIGRYNATISESNALLDLNRTLRDMQRANSAAKDVKGLNEAINRLEGRLLPYQEMFNRVQSRVATAAANVLDKILEFSERAAENLRQGMKGGIFDPFSVPGKPAATPQEKQAFQTNGLMRDMTSLRDQHIQALRHGQMRPPANMQPKPPKQTAPAPRRAGGIQ